MQIFLKISILLIRILSCFTTFLWSDPEPDPDNLIGSGADQKGSDPNPQHWLYEVALKLCTGRAHCAAGSYRGGSARKPPRSWGVRGLNAEPFLFYTIVYT